MKKSLIAVLLASTAAASLSASAAEYDYSCESITNKKLFNLGDSQQINVEFNSGYLSIDNRSGIWNHLALVSQPGQPVYFRSLPKENQLQTGDLIVAINRSLAAGANGGQLIIYKRVNQTTLAQKYNCKLTSKHN
jgi:hypothetical protein